MAAIGYPKLTPSMAMMTSLPRFLILIPRGNAGMLKLSKFNKNHSNDANDPDDANCPREVRVETYGTTSDKS